MKFGIYFRAVSQSRTGQALIRIFCVLVHIVIRDGIFRGGLHLHSRSMRQHPQVFKQPLPKASQRYHNQFLLKKETILFLATV